MPRSNNTRQLLHTCRNKILTLVILISLLSMGTLQPANVRAIGAPLPVAETTRGMARQSYQPDEPPGVDVEAEFVGRTAYTRTARNADGTLTTTISPRPLHWQDPESQQWREFVNTLRTAPAEAAQQGFAYENTANGFRAQFGKPAEANNGKPVLRFEVAGAALSMMVPSLRARDVSVNGAQATYADVFPGIDLRYTVDNERIKEEIVLHTVAAAARAKSFRFDLALDGVNAVKQANNAIHFVDGSGQTRFIMPPMFMLDSNQQLAPEARYSSAINVTLSPLGAGKVRLLVEPDLAWLQDPARVYPVVVDPTISTATHKPAEATATDAFADQANPTTNYGGSALLQLGRNASGQRQDLLIKFTGLDALPKDSAVTQASLRLNAASGTAGIPVNLYRNIGNWDDTTVTWNTLPSMDSTIRASLTTAVPGWNTIDITDLAQRWVRGEYPNQGVRMMSGGASGAVTSFHSSSATDTTLRPELQVTYVQATRYGLDKQWQFTSQDHGGGTTSYVNLSTGNVVVQHRGGSVPARGFDVDLTHTYNSQDPFGRHGPMAPTPNTVLLPGGFYGSGWSFAQGLRLTEMDGGNVVIFKDGSGSANRAYVKETDTNGTRSYLRPLHYELKLTKDVKSTPTDPAKVYTMVADSGGGKYFFDAEGKITAKQDRNGNTLSYAYDTSDRLTSITDVAGRTATLEYNGAGGKLSKITDMAGRVSTYAYDTADTQNLRTIKHGVGTADEVTTTFAYVSSGQLEYITNPRGHTSAISYKDEHDWDQAGNTEGWVVASGPATVAQSTEQPYSGAGSLKVSVSNLTNTTYARIKKPYASPQTFNSVPVAFLVRIYVPAGAPTLRASLIVGYQSSSAAYGANLVSGEWNNFRAEAVQVDPSTPVQVLTLQMQTTSDATPYTGPVYFDRLFFKGIATSVTDAKPTRNTLARYSYNWDTKTTTVERPDQAGTYRASTYRYTGTGQVNRVTDPLNNVTDTGFDEFLRLASVTLPGGTASSYTYSYYPNSNQLQTMTNELGEKARRGVDTTTGDTRYLISPLNEQHRASNADYEATIFNRDAATGNVTSMETNMYAAGTNLEQSPFPTRQSNLRMASFSFGAGGVIANMTDPKGNVTYMGYQTGTGYLTSIDSPPGNGETTRRVTTITPNTDGTTQKVVDPKGQTTTYEYDGLGRLRKINYGVVNGVPAFSRSYTLDANGNMTAMSDNTGASSWSYDENNRRTSESRTQNSVTKTVGYSYFANGLMQTLTTFNNQAVNFGYDAALRLTSQTDPKDGGRAITYGYDTRSRRTSVTFGSGVSQQLVYDKAGRVDLITLQKNDGTKLQSFDYEYGVGTADYRNGYVTKLTEMDSSQVTYDYDDLNRLTSAVRTGTNPFNQSYAYDLNNNRTSITSNGVTTNATYDAANQMTNLGSTSYTYDRNGNVTAFGSNSLAYNAANQWTSGTVNGQSVAFGYDGFGRRISRTVGSNRSDYWYDETGMTLETGASSATYLRSPEGMLLSNYTTALYNYGRDRMGSITALVNTSGALANTYSYDPWGKSIGTTGTTYNPFQYTGTYLDSATGLYQMGARYYQPQSGRFTQLDPLPSSTLSSNRYAYAGCNPSNRTDPTGLISAGCAFSVAATVLGIVGAVALLGLFFPPAVAPAVALVAIGASVGFSLASLVLLFQTDANALDQVAGLIGVLTSFLFSLPFLPAAIVSTLATAYGCLRDEGIL